jgi:MFS family permease
VTAAKPTGWYPLLLATASIGIANSVVFTLLSDLQDKYGFSDAGLGLIAGTGFFVGFLGLILLAPLADRGHAKTLMLCGLGLAVLGSVLFAASSGLVMLVIARAVVGLSNSVFAPASRAIVISMSDEHVAERLGRVSGVELAGFVTGPVIGGLLVGPFGVRVPFLVCGAFALAGAIMLANKPLPRPPIGERHRVAFDLLRIPRVRAGVFMAMALFLPVGFYDALLDRFLTDLGASNQLISMAFLMFGVPFAFLASRGGRLADKHGALRIALLSTACVAPLTAFYGWITVPILFVSLGLVEGILQAMGIPAAAAVIATGAPEGRAGAAQGLAGAGSMLLGATTAYMAGPIYKHLGPRWVFGIAGAGVWFFSLLAISQRGRRPAAIAVS